MSEAMSLDVLLRGEAALLALACVPTLIVLAMNLKHIPDQKFLRGLKGAIILYIMLIHIPVALGLLAGDNISDLYYRPALLALILTLQAREIVEMPHTKAVPVATPGRS